MPKISIITPSFNQGNYIKETILSIVNQDYSNYELIIIDGGSTDNTLEVIHNYEQYITYWVSEKDRGQSHAIQKGLDVATGDIINWINSDDIVAPGAFYRIASEFDFSQYDVICGKCDYFLEDLNNLDLQNMRMGVAATVGETMVQHKINQPSTFFKASVLKELGVNEQYRYTMDVDLWYRYLLEHGQMRVFLSDGLFTYFRLHEASKSVAESGGFKGEVWMVHFNILFSTNQDAVLLGYASQLIPNAEQFAPTRYKVKISAVELRAFVRFVAWQGVLYYNEQHEYELARQCLTIAYRNGQSMNGTLIKQMLKHYILPRTVLEWLDSNLPK